MPAKAKTKPSVNRRASAADVLYLEPRAWDAFMLILDNPPAPNAELRKLMASKQPWD